MSTPPGCAERADDVGMVGATADEGIQVTVPSEFGVKCDSQKFCFCGCLDSLSV